MAFDTRGRLWVTSTQEYPFAVKKEKWSADTTRALGSKDTIRILEDRDGDGRADQVTIFADDLNIPTGLQPYKNGCIAWSIPNILFLEDTQHNGRAERADSRRILFGPLGYEKDTHGMISSMRLGLDGWIYATHGFSNNSHFPFLTSEPQSQPRTRNQKPENLGHHEWQCVPLQTRRFRRRALDLRPGQSLRPLLGFVGQPLLRRLPQLADLPAHPRRRVSALRQQTRPARLRPRHVRACPRQHRHLRPGLPRRRRLGPGVGRPHVRLQPRHLEDQSRPHHLHRLHPEGERAARLPHQRRRLVPPGRSPTRPRWRALHRRFLQQDHRPLRSAVGSSRSRPEQRADLARGAQSRPSCHHKPGNHSGHDALGHGQV